jgi:adenylate kinase family enzyme
MKILITGRSGTGKSTVCKVLQQQGHPAFDADRVPGLCAWVDAKTHEPVCINYNQPINRTMTLWYWSETILQDLLASMPNIFLCGGADNDLEFRESFDKIFVLTLPSETQRQRIVDRVEHDYGKLPAMQRLILAEQAEFVQHALQAGAIPLDATRTPAEIVAAIVEYTT